MLRLTVFFCLFAAMAHAGAWPRDQGRIFTANSIELKGVRLDRDLLRTPYYSSSYLEYGLGRSLTLGLHMGHGSTARLDARAFLRVPLSQTDPHRVAVEVSAGYHADREYVGLGLQYGRGFKVFDRFGWLSLESRVDFHTGSRTGTGTGAYRQAKLDVTLGLTHGNGIKTMAQLFVTETNDEIYATFAPVVVIPVWKQLKLETGLLYDIAHGTERGLKIGFWQEF